MTEHATTGSADDRPTNESAATAEPVSATDPKERFREALERKNAAGHRTTDGARSGAGVHGPEVTGGGKRTFRRKTG